MLTVRYKIHFFKIGSRAGFTTATSKIGSERVMLIQHMLFTILNGLLRVQGGGGDATTRESTS